MTHPSPKRNMVPKAVLIRSSLVSLTTARPVNTAQPRTIVNSARPMTNGKNVNAVGPKVVVNAARLKIVVNVVKGNHVNAVKASGQSTTRFRGEKKGLIDSGCSRHIDKIDLSSTRISFTDNIECTAE
ncbi:hypothetical protein Tco_0553074 [Tanacetum coccineum]